MHKHIMVGGVSLRDNQQYIGHIMIITQYSQSDSRAITVHK
jgi:hypothetical protein